jgi:hypothetical protein
MLQQKRMTARASLMVVPSEERLMIHGDLIPSNSTAPHITCFSHRAAVSVEKTIRYLA